MIRDYLIPEIKKTFPGWEMQIDHENNPIVSFPAAQKEVGRLFIHDDGHEATVSVENITHSHFNCYGFENLTQQEREKTITEDVIRFLQALFSDRVLLFFAKDKRSGGWSTFDNGPVELSPKKVYYLWSKPYP